MSEDKDRTPELTNFKTINKTEWNSLESLFEAHAGLSFEKQLIFGDFIGSNAWQLDLGKGSILFGDLELPIQVIGSLSFNNSSWMWGWANTQSGIPENLLIQSKQLKALGEQKDIKELIEGHFNVDEGFEHKIGMLACGQFSSKSYYCANYGQGTLVITIDDDRIPEIEMDKIEKVLTCFPQLIGGITVHHENAFLNYLIDRDFKIHHTEHKIEGLKNKKILSAEFDASNRLISLNGKI
ncbi:hypothetical protein H0I23_04040 [Cellulophaga sp. HaHaR_3_176]|uniref:DUF6882 domain-containing protein n=1 Tax=Cellulophaga sp. HaHaR_3_176 TaxID=1942464 RepID=UPI001C1FFEBB|nr:DUF6882 domain-containing protein [Cellulophaga sp. HaHaR_3_176]QWX84820.1 hypothetical protein H0I23_04040 [Cellulophaga sp. HaHaR_3_176]